MGESISLKTEPFNESFRASAQISGVLVTGVIGNGTTFADSLKVGAYVPPEWAGKDFCMRVLSASGFYEAQNAYAVDPSWKGGFAELPFLTAHPEKWLSVPAPEIGVLASPGACSNGAQEATVAFWNTKPDLTGDAVSLTINSFGADEVIVFVGEDDSAEPVKCDKLSAKNIAAFDLTCRITLPKLRDVLIEISRTRSGNVDPPYFLHINRSL